MILRPGRSEGRPGAAQDLAGPPAQDLAGPGRAAASSSSETAVARSADARTRATRAENAPSSSGLPS
ncbi:hypothetical protein ACGFJC_09305 [Nonomuraea fuscirosea]|uniref:hypothetical protein n=1 Tax=Nonomuraea fuscirosea TaxID=1291556 RepID=UPI00371D81C0